eukprot:TRINITY_DN2886_c0_g1_i1.p1 TRINITY_DN2886_c0_g1~~TRINITY_DN2886_c0_g1_i1.p1  ORF type:complete len:695 (-),score=145.14 TRINITY_DN2886_c0_g1_i1:282-2366(-)
MHQKLERHLLQSGGRFKYLQNFLCLKYPWNLCVRNCMSTAGPNYGCSQQISPAKKFYISTTSKQTNFLDLHSLSQFEGALPFPLCYQFRQASGLSRRPQLVDNICKQLQLTGWNSSTIHVLEGFDSIITPKTVTLVLNGKIPYESAMGFFNWLKNKDGFRPTVSMYNAMIKLLGRLGKIDEIQSIVNYMSDTGCEMDIATYMNLINAYSAANDIDNVLKVYNMIKKNDCVPNVAFYTDLIHALAKGKQYEKLSGVFHEMIESEVNPNVGTFFILMKALQELARLDVAFEIFQKLKRMNIRPSPSMYALFIEEYAKAGNIEVVEELINEMKGYAFSAGPIFSNIIEVLNKEGKKEKSAILSRLFWSDVKSRPKILERPAEKQQEVPGYHEKPSWWEIAGKVQIWTPSIVSYLEGLSIDWQSHQVVLIIKRMRYARIASAFYNWLKNSGFKHDEHTTAALVLRLTQSKMFPEALQLMNEAKAEGLKLPLLVCNQVIGAASVNRNFEIAQSVLNLIKNTGLKPNLMTYSTLIVRLAQSDQNEAALEIYQAMLSNGICPDNTSVATLLYCLGSSGNPEKAESISKELMQYGLKFNTLAYLSLIYTYCKNGKTELAVKAHNQMKTVGLVPLSADEATNRVLTSLQNIEEAAKLQDEDVSILESLFKINLSKETGYREQLTDIHNLLVENLTRKEDNVVA